MTNILSVSLLFLAALLAIDAALTMPQGVATGGKAGKCDFAWHSHGTHCYRIFYKKRTWFEAADRCAKFGGVLSTVEDAMEDGFLGGLLTGPGLITPHWIGLMRKNMEMPAIWADGVKRTFARWRTGDNEYTSAETKCVRVIASSVSSCEWLAEDCGKEYPYICKKPVN
ncbi:hypothetical protein L596_015303 [Steinernema carpocapsae]|uniref:C-type lectin domain-containing protein n=1 Tax=Steinernema carpocapsae TaxID=34508 RepID=A0A4V6A374_STECR|nr:hypothetical protein L596_015303 [Steinernema carpocapsae]